MSRNTPQNRKAASDKIARKKQKEQESAAKRKQMLREIVNKQNASK